MYCLLVCTTIQAQDVVTPRITLRPTVNYIFRNLDNTNGLIGNKIGSIAQDKKGYIWIGTDKGLQRYDGVRFINCTDTGNIATEPLYVGSIFTDIAQNRIVYTDGTRMKAWNYYTNKTSLMPVQNEWKKDSGAEIFMDQRGNKMQFQLLLTRNVNNNGNVAQGLALVTIPDKPDPDFAIFIHDKIHEEVWVAVPDQYLFLFDLKQKKVYSTQYSQARNTLKSFLGNNVFPSPFYESKLNTCRNFRIDHHGNFWIITWSHYIFRYNLFSRKLYRYDIDEIIKNYTGKSLPYASVNDFLDDNHGNLWIATSYGGLLQYRFADSSFTHVARWPGNALSLQYNHDIFTLFQDREENIWVGSDKGISIFNPNHQYFTPLNDSLSQPQSVSSTEMESAFQARNGDLYVGYWGDGISVYDAGFHLKKKFLFQDVYAKNQVWSFMQNDDGNIWAGCQYGLLHIIDPATLSLKTIRPPEFENMTVRVIVRDHEGNLAFGLHSGKVVVWNKKLQQFLPFKGERPAGPSKLSSVESMLIAPSGACIVGMANGLREFNMQKQCFEDTICYPPSEHFAFIHNMNLYRGDTILVAMGTGGLYFFDTKHKTFTSLRKRVPEAPSSAFATKTDEEGNIWFTSDYAIYKYEPAQNKLSTFRPQKGLLNASFTYGRRILEMLSGKWITWTTTELITFDPKKLTAAQTDTSRISITGLKVFDRYVPVDSFLAVQKPLELSYKENFITIEYSNMLFSGVESAKYYYRLSKIDKDWVNAGNRAYASYTNLRPGQYRFEVKNAAPETNHNIAFIDIVIDSPFWGTVWFKTLCIALLAGIIYALLQWRIRTIRYESRMKEQIATTKVMALRAQMNPHFIFNCINSIDALIQYDDKYRAAIYLNKFAKLIRSVLDSSMQSAVTLGRDIETLQLYIELEQLRNENKFTATINVDDNIDPDVYKVPPLIIQPYVENAILHGIKKRPDNHGRLNIDIRVIDHQLIYVIEDNGIGREASKKAHHHKSYGMDVSRERIKLFNRQEKATITITDLQSNGAVVGTKVEVILNLMNQ